MQGFSQRVQGLLQLLKEGEREELIAKLDPAMAQKLKERREKEKGMPGKGGLNPELDKKISYRGNGVPEPQELGNAMLESAGRYHLTNNPPEVRFSEGDSEDFTTCQRPDGSKYGTTGQCRKGKEVPLLGDEEIAKMSTKDLIGVKKQMDERAFGKDAKPVSNEMLQGMADQNKRINAELKRRGEGPSPVAPTPPKNRVTSKDPVANVLRIQKETSDLMKKVGAEQMKNNPALRKEVEIMMARRKAFRKAQELGNAMLESAGKYHLQNNPPEVRYAEEGSEDFATCERPDGSRYGTSGQCRKGKETSAKAKEKKAKIPPPVNREAADRFKKERQELMEKLAAHRAKMDFRSDADQKEMKRMGNEMTRYDMLIDKALGGTQWKRYERGTGETLDIDG